MLEHTAREGRSVMIVLKETNRNTNTKLGRQSNDPGVNVALVKKERQTSQKQLNNNLHYHKAKKPKPVNIVKRHEFKKQKADR